MNGLDGIRVGLLETRMSNELARFVTRHGGEPICVPAVRETPVKDCEAAVLAVLDGIRQGTYDIVVLLTGVAVTMLFDRADALGLRGELVAALRSVSTVCRGPKPQAALRGFGVTATKVAGEPFTTPQLLDTLATLPVAGAGVALLHYGERNGTLAETLRARDARVGEICLYEWQMPENIQPLRDFVHTILGGGIEVLAITCQVQVRHLFAVADELGLASALRSALNGEVVVASVGPTCTAALEAYGITPHVVPEHSKMGPMVSAIARYMTTAGARRRVS